MKCEKQIETIEALIDSKYWWVCEACSMSLTTLDTSPSYIEVCPAWRNIPKDGVRIGPKTGREIRFHTPEQNAAAEAQSKTIAAKLRQAGFKLKRKGWNLSVSIN
jgi:hypothetical protein